MSALEKEIIEKFHQLESSAKQRILALIEQEVASEVGHADTATFDYEAWFREVETIRQQIRASHGNRLPSIDVVEMLRDIRDGEDE